MSAAHKLSLAVQYASTAKHMPTRPQFRRWVKAALQRDVQITLRLVDENEGRYLNKSFRGKDYATNVLTFVYGNEQLQHGGAEPSGVGGAARWQLPQSAGFASNVSQPPPIYGDLVICAPVAAREARKQRKNLTEYYAHLTVHAVLHLQGYEHEEEDEAAAMEARETAILMKLGYADPYKL